ncbi:MAG: 4Fe-4S binding protein [Thermincola sp.]|jgi:ferredoxin|nr:4Fe-4S binding protein [Thermincola sp.]MDT3702540.1 4Fe-4S binding protein [Thermincola sp.]
MTELSALLSEKITFAGERCMNSRNCNIKCDNCLPVCPTKAISLENGEISFDELNCKNCGACRAVCPSEAFSVADFAYLKEFSSLQSDEISIGCTLNDANRRDFNINCYALLTEGEILYLLGNKKRVMFNTAHCHNCSFASCSKIFLSSLKRAQEMLTTDNRIVLTETDSQNSGVSRRAFFQWFRQKTVTAVANVLPFAEKASKTYLPKRRQSLLQGMKNLAHDLAEKTFVRRINILPSCTGCGGCIRVCPNQAYRGDEFNLTWQAKGCMNCGLCIATCPEKALRFEDFLTPAELFKERVSIDFKGSRCVKCGAYFHGHGDTCPACSVKNKQLEQNFDLCLQGAQSA